MARATKHPGKTPAQRRVLDQIGCGDNSPIAPKATFAALEKAGLIVRISDRTIGADRFGNIRIKAWEMPVHVHMAWCEYHAEQFDKAGGVE